MAAPCVCPRAGVPMHSLPLPQLRSPPPPRRAPPPPRAVPRPPPRRRVPPPPPREPGNTVALLLLGRWRCPVRGGPRQLCLEQRVGAAGWAGPAACGVHWASLWNAIHLFTRPATHPPPPLPGYASALPYHGRSAAPYWEWAGLSLAPRLDASRRQVWRVAPARGAYVSSAGSTWPFLDASMASGRPVTIESVGQAGAFALAASSHCSNGQVLLGRRAAWTKLQAHWWVLVPGPHPGTVHIASYAHQACQRRWLGASTRCGVTQLGLYSRSDRQALLTWQLVAP